MHCEIIGIHVFSFIFFFLCTKSVDTSNMLYMSCSAGDTAGKTDGFSADMTDSGIEHDTETTPGRSSVKDAAAMFADKGDKTSSLPRNSNSSDMKGGPCRLSSIY